MNNIILGNCVDVLDGLDDESVDAFITSPPYDNLRDYNGYSFPFEEIATKMYQKLAKGGVIVWVVGDAVLKGSETGSSFLRKEWLKLSSPQNRQSLLTSL